jgi:hypothetical protein|nr:MAG TPA: hypothetical protein [Caudoviricetes sp.]
MISRDARITNLSRLLNDYCADKPEIFQPVGYNNPTASTMHYTSDVVYGKLKKLNYPYIDPTGYNSYFDASKMLEAIGYSSDSNVFSDEDTRKIYNYIMDEMSTILDNQFNGYLTVYNSIIDDVVTYLKDHDSSIKNVTLYKKELRCNDEIGKGRIDPNLMSIKVWYRLVDILYKFQCTDDIHHIDYIYKDKAEYFDYDCSVNGVIFKKYNDIKHTILQSCMRYTMCHCIHSMDDLRATIDKLNNQSYLDGLIKIYLYDGLVVDCFYEVEYNDGVTNTYYVFAMPLPASSSSDIERTDGRICVFDVDTPICIANQFIRFNSVGFVQDANVTGKLNGYSSMIDKMYASFKDTNILDNAINDVSIKEYKDICKLYLGRYKHVTKIDKCLFDMVDFEGASSIITCNMIRLVLWLNFMRHAIIPIRHIYEEKHNKDIFDVINDTINITLVDYMKSLKIFVSPNDDFLDKFDIVITSYIGYANEYIEREFCGSLCGIKDEEIEASVKAKIVDLYDQLYVVDREDKNLEYNNVNSSSSGLISIVTNIYHNDIDKDRYGTIFNYLAPTRVKVMLYHKNPNSNAAQDDINRMQDIISHVFSKQQFTNKYIQDLERMISTIFYQTLITEFTQIMIDNVYRAIIGNIRRFIKRFTEIAKDEYPDVFNKRHKNFKELLAELTYYLSFDSMLITDVHRLKKLHKIVLVGSK